MLSCVYYPTTYVILVVCINIVGEQYEHDNELSKTIMTMKIKWTIF